MSQIACKYTPLQFSDTFQPSSIDSLYSPTDGTPIARFTALLSGTGKVSTPSDKVGITIDEQLQDSFTLSSNSYGTLIDMRIVKGGHKIYPWVDISGHVGTAVTQSGVYSTAPLEVYIYFKDSGGNILALVLPIGIANGSSNASTYIRALSRNPTGPMPVTLFTLFTDLSGTVNSSSTNQSFITTNGAYTYTGEDIRIYNNQACDTSSTHPMYPITYVVIQSLPGSGFSSTITQDDYTTLLKYNITTIPGSFYPVDTLSANIKQLNGLILSSVQASATSERSSKISTSAVKCYPVDPSKNIKDNQLYLNLDGSPKDTLADELAPPNDTTESAPSFWTSASGIETIVGIVVASMIVLIVATILIRRNYTAIGTTASTFIAKTTAKSVAKTATSAVTSTSSSAIGSILTSISSSSTIIFASLFVMTLILFIVFLILYLTK